MTTLAMLAGGILGVLLRHLVDGPRRSESPARWQPVIIGVLGALVLGVLTGAAVIGVQGDADGDGPAAALSVSLSGALLTYCLFSSAATELFKHGLSRQTLMPAVTSALSAFIAATAGVALGVTIVS